MANGGESVRFTAADLRPAAELVRAFATPADEIVRWVTVAAVDPPESALPKVKGLLGREKRADPPGFQVIYSDPGPLQGHTLNVDARGVMVADVLTATGVTVPAGWDADGNKHALVVQVPFGATAEQLLEFGVSTLTAVLGGWDGAFEAEGVDIVGLGPYSEPTGA
jgi:hypothetical protein